LALVAVVNQIHARIHARKPDFAVVRNVRPPLLRSLPMK
jgi:hypothetical protein